jgi:hypothetical protein
MKNKHKDSKSEFVLDKEVVEAIEELSSLFP